MGKLDGKVFLGIGTASGMGKATALRFGAEGAKVVVCDLPDHQGEDVAQAISDGGGEAIFTALDVLVPEQIQAGVDLAVETYGKIDVMLYMPGMNCVTKLLDLSLEIWNHVLNLNLTGAFLALQMTAKSMKKTGGGSIIMTSSLNSTVTYPRFGSYSVTKVGMDMLARVAAVELGPDIRVNTICPGFMDTPLTKPIFETPGNMDRIMTNSPLKRLGTVEDYAKLALFLASDDSAFVSGQNIIMDGAAGIMGYPDVIDATLKHLGMDV